VIFCRQNYLITVNLKAILICMNLQNSRAAQRSVPNQKLDIRLDTINPFVQGVGIAASSGSSLVTLQAPDRSTAKAIVRNWQALVSLNQDISGETTREVVRTFRDLACAFGAEVVRDVDGLPGPLVSRTAQLEIKQQSSGPADLEKHRPFTWTHIERPNKKTIEWAAARAGLKTAELEDYLDDSHPCTALKSSTCLVTRSYELALSEGKNNVAKVTAKRCTIICGNDFLITLSNEPTTAVRQVWKDIKNERAHAQEHCSASAVARLLVEATLGQYQQTVEELSRQIGDFWKAHVSRTPRDADIRTPQAMREDLRTCEHFMLGFDDALSKLEQREILEGRAINPSLRENVLRTLAELDRSLTRCDQDIRDGESSWASLRDHWKNQILFKLAVLSGLFVPVGVWAGIGGMNFTQPLSDSILWSGLAASALVSAALVGGLIAGKRDFLNFLSGPPKEP